VRAIWLTAVSVGVSIGLVLVAISFSPGTTPLGSPPQSSGSPGNVTIIGVRTNITYARGSNETFEEGQNDCTMRCPRVLAGGYNWTFVVFTFVVGSGGKGTLISLNITSPLPFEAVNCFPPGPCGLTTTYRVANFSSEWGEPGLSQEIKLVVSDPAPNYPNGFWIYCNATANLTRL
jgi:hypothetical protein